MNGAVIPNTPVAVDFWSIRRCPQSRVFFLSHMHTDHTAGLTSSWNTYRIYCSDVTRELAIAKLGLRSELVVGLPLDEPVTIKLDEVGQEMMTVTLIDANHCPGSVMFVFEGYFGRILYTGDFRFCERFLTHSATKGKRFDILYLDNTYCDPKCAFPSRSSATMTIMEIIRNHPQHKVIIGLHSLGKEVLLRAIAVTCKIWIGVDATRMETLKLLQMPDVFTCDVDRTKIQVVKTREITKRNIQMWNSVEPTIAILPTCLYVGGQNPYENVPNVFVVPYSDHCSFEELRRFVESIKPKKIIPIVHKHRLSPGDTINNRVNMNIFHQLMDSSPSVQYEVPHSVERYMTEGVAQETGRKRRAKIKKKAPLRKVPKYKEPCGVVFPPSLEISDNAGKNCLAGDISEGKSRIGLDDACDMARKISGVERNIAVPASRRQEIESVLKAEVENGIENNDFEPDQDATEDSTRLESDSVKKSEVESVFENNDFETDQDTKEDSSRLESDTVSKIEVENVSKDNNFDTDQDAKEKLKFHVVSCVEEDNTDTHRELKQLSEHNKINIDAVDEQQKKSKKRKFNVYTGYSCDFARKCLEEILENEATVDRY